MAFRKKSTTEEDNKPERRRKKKERAEGSERKQKKKEKKDRTSSRRPKKEKRGRRGARRAQTAQAAPQEASEGVVFSAVQSGTVSEAAGFSIEADDSGFVAGVRAAEPILRMSDTRSEAAWRTELLPNFAGAVFLAAFMSLFCMAAESPILIPFTLAGVVLFLILTTIEMLRPGKVKWIVAGAFAVVLIASGAIMHSSVFGGIAYAVNQFYDVAEQAQAYLYHRISIGDSESYTSAYIGAAWLSCVIGLLAALPPAGLRRSIFTVFAVIALFAFAYYGIVPSWICTAGLMAAFILVISRGSILSILPVLLAASLVFAAVMLVDPGENYGISRFDENFRDRFAFNSSLIQSQDPYYDNTNDMTDWDNDGFDDEEFDDGYDGEYSTYFALGAVALILLAIAAAAFILLRRRKKKRDEVRAGINSRDPKEAVIAMFPYLVRWLKAFGVDVPPAPFSAMIPLVTREFSEMYGRRFSEMYALWREAAYSDHEISEAGRQNMERFMNDTIDIVKDRSTFGEKLKMKLKYAL